MKRSIYYFMLAAFLLMVSPTAFSQEKEKNKEAKEHKEKKEKNKGGKEHKEKHKEHKAEKEKKKKE